MNILLSVHLYPPHHNCGGEYYIHNMAKWLISQGHQCRVLIKQHDWHMANEIYFHEGVEVFPSKICPEPNLFFWADIVFSHLDFAIWTKEMCKIYKRPFFFIAHNSCQDEYDGIYNSLTPVNIIFNSQWIKDTIKTDHRSFVMPPPVDWRKYDVSHSVREDREYKITLINLNENKGGKQFEAISSVEKKRKFLGVKGSYDEQIIPKWENVEICDNTPDILPIYARTRLLLMPSKYESWGMTATEAMCNGIPVLSSGTPGLRENCGNAGIYLDRDDIGSWIAAIKELDKPKVYEKYSKLARERSRQLDPLAKYEELNQFIHEAF